MSDWPELDVTRDQPTFATLHLASQMLGKMRVAYAPWINHGWHVTLRPTAYGLEAAPIATDSRNFTLAIDLCSHSITLAISDGERDEIPFRGQTIADLHAALIAMLDRYHLPSKFNSKPSEIADAKRFADDDDPRAYDRDSATRLLGALNAVVPVFEKFRAGFSGKASPVHFFWGGFDLAITRFSGRKAPPHPGGFPGLPDRITREAYSHEESSAGFWLGGVTAAEPIFYSYAYPEPKGYRETRIEPPAARFDLELGEFVLPYAEVRAAADPDDMLMRFLETTYDAAANRAHWDRKALEREPVAP